MIDKFLCWLGQCRNCVLMDLEEGCWGECVNCRKRHGFVSRADLRSYLEREARNECQNEAR
jgi:hypothetical protein